MASTDFTNNSTVIDAAWLDDVDVAAYSSLSSVAGTNTITATGPVPLSAYASGQMFRFIPANTNTGATTINITPSGGSALGAKNLYFNGAACTGGEIRQNQPCIVVYDGTQFNLIGPFAAGTIPGPVVVTGVLSSVARVHAFNGTAPPAGGTVDVGIEMSNVSSFGIFFGTGAPSLNAAKGSLYLRRDGTTTNDRAYINTDGGGTWTALTTAA